MSTKLIYVSKKQLVANSVAHQYCKERTQKNTKYNKNAKIHWRGALSAGLV